MSRTTTAPAPITVRAPMRQPESTEAPMPIIASSPIVTPAPTVAPADTCAKSPIAESWSTELFVFRSTPRPIVARGSTRAPAGIEEPGAIGSAFPRQGPAAADRGAGQHQRARGDHRAGADRLMRG